MTKKNVDINTIKRLKKEIPLREKTDKQQGRATRIQKLKDRHGLPYNNDIDLIEFVAIAKFLMREVKP